MCLLNAFSFYYLTKFRNKWKSSIFMKRGRFVNMVYKTPPRVGLPKRPLFKNNTFLVHKTPPYNTFMQHNPFTYVFARFYIKYFLSCLNNHVISLVIAKFSLYRPIWPPTCLFTVCIWLFFSKWNCMNIHVCMCVKLISKHFYTLNC